MVRLGGIFSKYSDELCGRLHQPENRRGDFHAYASGYSMGQGQSVPTTTVFPSTRVEEMFHDFRDDLHALGMIRFADREC